jgi:hypothetical protein
VLEAVKIVKKAEGVTGNEFVDFPAKKFCLHMRWAQGEEGVRHQTVSSAPRAVGKALVQLSARQQVRQVHGQTELAKFKENRDVVVITIPELPVTSIKWSTSPGLAASQAVV